MEVSPVWDCLRRRWGRSGGGGGGVGGAARYGSLRRTTEEVSRRRRRRRKAVDDGCRRRRWRLPRTHPPHAATLEGGGFASISAACALQNASFKVIVLESRGRIGGRAYPDYSFGFPVDMGAAWLHGACEKNPLAPIIGGLGLPLYRTSGDDSVLFDHDLESYALYDTDGHQIPQELVKYVGGIFASMLNETEKLRQETSNDMPLAKAITKVLERWSDLRLEGLAAMVLVQARRMVCC